MPPARGQPNPDCPGCRELKSRVRALEEALVQQGQLVSNLQQQVGKLEQEGHRQAAPFRKPESKRKDEKDKPGRKKGHPPSYRQPPPTVDEHVEVPLPQCPQCQG